MSKHTPGPWVAGYGEIVGIGEVFGVGTETEPNWTPICFLSFAENVNETDMANSRLIATAPELLEALKSLVCIDYRSWDNSAQQKWEAACAAVAKAEGESKL